MIFQKSEPLVNKGAVARAGGFTLYIILHSYMRIYLKYIDLIIYNIYLEI